MKIFLSHNSKDKAVVEQIGKWLTNRGYLVWLDKWSMTAGDSLIEKVGQGIESSDKLVVFLTEDSVESNWVKKEVATGLILEMAEEKGLGSKFVIPALLKACKIPIMLRDKIYANFTDKPFETACQELLNGLLNKPFDPLNEKLENRILRFHEIPPSKNSKNALLIEFGVKISPTQGLHIGLDCGSKFKSYNEWFNLPNKAIIPQNTGGVFTSSAVRNEPPLFARKFQTPNISSSLSYYVYLESDEPFKLNGRVKFLDFFDQEP